MGLFGIFRREGPQPQSPQRSQLSRVAEKPSTKPISGEFPQKDFLPEVQEHPKTVRCPQCRFGKLLQSPDGPIIQGFEHTITGLTAGIEQEGLRRKLFSAFDYQISSQPKYPWKDGEIIKQIVEIDGVRYALCARRMLRPESGKENVGRDYTEMHAILIPEDEWSVSLIPQLAEKLQAKGVTERNMSLAPIEFKTNILDKPLPPNWFDEYTKELIAHIASGKQISLQDVKISEKDFLQKLFYCLICLPENIARQISFGVGLDNSKNANVRIAQTKMAMSDIRKVGEKWKGEQEEDMIFAQRYLATLLVALKDCSTPRQVMQAVHQIPQNIKSEIERRFRTFS